MIRKAYFWGLLCVFMAPLFFHFKWKPLLRASLDDSRAIFLATPLESIQGAQAGERVSRQIQREDVVYEVIRGDSWWSIAQRFRIRNVEALTEANKDIKLMPGTKIRIPANLLEAQP